MSHNSNRRTHRDVFNQARQARRRRRRFRGQDQENQPEGGVDSDGGEGHSQNREILDLQRQIVELERERLQKETVLIENSGELNELWNKIMEDSSDADDDDSSFVKQEAHEAAKSSEEKKVSRRITPVNSERGGISSMEEGDNIIFDAETSEGTSQYPQPSTSSGTVATDDSAEEEGVKSKNRRTSKARRKFEWAKTQPRYRDELSKLIATFRFPNHRDAEIFAFMKFLEVIEDKKRRELEIEEYTGSQTIMMTADVHGVSGGKSQEIVRHGEEEEKDEKSVFEGDGRDGLGRKLEQGDRYHKGSSSEEDNYPRSSLSDKKGKGLGKSSSERTSGGSSSQRRKNDDPPVNGDDGTGGSGKKKMAVVLGGISGGTSCASESTQPGRNPVYVRKPLRS